MEFESELESYLVEIDKMEIEADNNDYDSPKRMALLTGRRFAYQRGKNLIGRDQEYILEQYTTRREHLRIEIEEHRVRRKANRLPISLRHARFVGEYNGCSKIIDMLNKD
jgi:hypothetical protein